MVYDVYKLIAKAEKLASTQKDVADFHKILVESCWCDLNGVRVTPQAVIDILQASHLDYEAAVKSRPELAEHVRQVQNADLQFPILLSEDDELLDGMHRLARHIVDGEKTIKAKILTISHVESSRIAKGSRVPHQ